MHYLRKLRSATGGIDTSVILICYLFCKIIVFHSPKHSSATVKFCPYSTRRSPLQHLYFHPQRQTLCCIINPLCSSAATSYCCFWKFSPTAEGWSDPGWHCSLSASQADSACFPPPTRKHWLHYLAASRSYSTMA